MAKKTINAVCESIQMTKVNSVARFTVEAKTEPATPGTPVVQRTAKTVVSIIFDTPDGVKDFVINKEAVITITQ